MTLSAFFSRGGVRAREEIGWKKVKLLLNIIFKEIKLRGLGPTNQIIHHLDSCNDKFGGQFQSHSKSNYDFGLSLKDDVS